MAFSRKTVDNFSHFSSCHIIFSDNQYNSVATQAVPILHQGSQQDIKAMLGPDFHYFNQGRDPKLCTLGDKHNLHYEGKIRKKKYFVCKNHRKLLPKHWGSPSAIIDSDFVKKFAPRQPYHRESYITLAKLPRKKNLEKTFSCGGNYKTAKCGDFLHFQKRISLCNWIWKRNTFFVFSFFHFLCKLIISTDPLSKTNREIAGFNKNGCKTKCIPFTKMTNWVILWLKMMSMD